MMDYAQRILDKTENGLQVFRLYMPMKFNTGKKFKNPFYDDHNASCFIYYDKHLQKYYMKDHGDPTYSGDCFWLVGLVHNLDDKTSFNEILSIINDDMGLGLDLKPSGYNKSCIRQPNIQTAKVTSSDVKTKAKAREFELKSREMSERELEFWSQYGITTDILNKYCVSAVSAFTSSGDNGPYTIRSTQERYVFAYSLDNFVKLYRPHETNRFYYAGEKPRNYCFGMKQLPTSGDMVFITGGEKDVLSLASHGFNAVCFNSETADFPADVMAILEERFRHIIIMYDSDDTGKAAMAKQTELWSEHGVISVTLPLAGTKEEKDVSDFFRKGMTSQQLRDIVGEAIAASFEESMLLISACEMDFTNPPIESERVVMVNKVAVASCDNLTCVTGGEGTGKSNLVSSLLAGALLTEKPPTDIDTLGFDILPNRQGKAVLHFDTEQSEQQLYKNTMMMMKRAGLDELPEFYHSFFLTTTDRTLRLKAIKDSMSLYYHKHGGVYMVVIDGVADLIKSANDETSSIAVVEQLYKLASCYHACIICVLHYVPNGIKLRGHLGSELQRKSATILSVEKDDNPAYSVTKVMKLRDGNPLDVPIQQFSWNKELEMFTHTGTKSEAASVNRKKTMLDQIVKSVYKAGEERYTHTELVKRVEEEADVKERTAKAYISDLYNDKIIVKQGDKYIINKNKSTE